MRNKLASSLLLALALVGTLVAPSFAASKASTSSDDNDTFKSVCMFPWKVAGSGVSTVIGVPEGATKDGTRGAIMATKWIAGKLGNEDGPYQLWVGGLVGGPFGALGGATYGCFDGAWHGLKSGYQEPFSKDSFTFKDE